MAAMMIGQPLGQVLRRARTTPGAVRLGLERLSFAGGAQATALQNISLEVRAGEVVGIAGVAGEGQGALMGALIGERPVAPAMLRIDGAAMGEASPTARRLAGAAFVPEDRMGHAAVTEMALPENILLSHHRAERLAKAGWIDRQATRTWSAEVTAAFDVQAGAAKPVAGSLSGGNLQKFVVGREILRNPGVLVVSQPTWGVDAGAAALIRSKLIELADRGAAVLVISQDLDELFEIADRIAVIYRGKLSAPLAVDGLTREQVGLLMAGAPEARAA
ncbi:MAG: ATP-binding cassette domain-containing protein, partial [Pseudomonadota bacterium]